MRTLVMVLVVGCSGGERPEWLPSPANAVAQCRHDIAPAEPYLATRVVHFDAQGRPVQYDTIQGFEIMIRESWVYEYDDRGRLLRQRQGEIEQRWAYSGNDVVHTGAFDSIIHYTLDDEGRVITSQQVTLGRPPMHFEYDTAGRLARRFGPMGPDGAPGERRFFYDARDRLTSVVDTDDQGERTTTVTYVDSSDQTSFEVRDPVGVVKNGFTVSFDDEGRIDGWSRRDGIGVDYVYTGGAIERHMGPTTTTMTGACRQPTLLLAPPPQRMTASIFLFETLYFFDGLG